MDKKELAAIGRRRTRAKTNLGTVTQEAREAAQQAAAEGITEVELAHLLEVDRMTIRDWLGKKR